MFARRTLALVAVIFLISCFGESTGPELRPARLAILPSFANPHAAGVVDFDLVRITLRRPGQTSIAFDTVISFPPGGDTLRLELAVPINGTSESFTLAMAMYNSALQDTVFVAGGTVTATTNTLNLSVAQPVLNYVGVGFDAAGVRFVTAPVAAFFGATVSLVAEAFDSGGAAIPGTPILFRLANPADSVRARIPDREVGQVVAGQQRGAVGLRAELLTNQFAAHTLTVQPVPNAVQVQGNNQTGAVGAALGQPIVARVLAADGLGVQGVIVTFAVTAGGGTLSATTDTTDGSGDVSVTWTLGVTLGAQTLTASAAGVTGSIGIGATATPGAATRLAFQVPPSSASASVPIAPPVRVVAQDAFGNTVTGFTGTVSLTIGANPGGATLGGTTSAAAAAGVATFANLTLDAPGTGYTLVAGATGLTSATSAAFDIVGGVPALLAFIVPPVTTTAGQAIPAVQVAIRDAVGTTVTTATNLVTIAIASNPGGGTLSGSTSVAAVNGIATFNSLSIDLAGTGYTLSAAATGLAGATSAAFDIGAGTPQTLQFTTPPSAATAGSAIAPAIVVRARDALGNTATGFTGSITLGFGANPGGATLSGTTSVNAVAGVATFTNVSLDRVAAGYTLTATAAGLTGTTSGAFGVGPAAAASLVFTVQPITTAAGATLSPAMEVTVLDAFGNVATGFTGNVTVAIGNNPGSATLVGTATVPAVAGIATFSTLTLTTRGAGYTLTAAAAGLSGTVSASFDMTALTLAWTNPAGGSWSNASNWSLGRVPQTTDSVVIALAGTYTVVLDTTFSASFLIVGGAAGTQTLSLSSRTLTVSGAMTVRSGGAFSPDNSTIAGTGTLINQGTLTLRYTTIGATIALDNQGTLVLNGTVNVNGPLTTAPGTTVRLQGDGTTGFATLTVASSFTNNGTLELTSSVSAYSSTVSVTGSNTLTNAAGGTIISLVATGGPRTIDAQLDNQGTVTMLQPLTLSHASAQHSNSGLMDASAVDWTLSQSGTAPSFTNTGTVTIGTGRTWTITNGTLNQSAGAIGGPGTLSLQTVTANFTTNVSNATTGLAVDNSVLNGPGTITNAAGRTLTLRYTTIGATSALINQGTLVLNGTVNANGPLTTAAGTTLRLQGDGTTGFATLTLASSFTNTGTLELTSSVSAYSSTVSVTGANTLTNAAGATIISLVGTGGPRTIDAQLDNQGTVTMLQPLTLSHASAQHSNSGLMDASAVDWTLSQSGTAPSFTNTGTVTIGTGRTWTITNGTLNQSAGAIGGPGTLSLQTVTANFTTNVSNATTGLAVDNSVLNGPGTITNAAGRTLTLRYTTIGATSALINQGTLVLNGTVNANGPLTTAAGTTLRLQGDGTTGFATLTLASSFTNTGTLELTSSVSAYSSTVSVTGANTLTNAAGATIISLVATGGPRTIDAQLDNQGTVTMLQPLTLSHASAQHSNSGLMDASAVDWTLSQSGTAPSFTNTGTVTIGTGRTWTITNGTLNQSAGAIGGPGTLSLQTVTANFTTNVSNATTGLAVDNSVLNGPGTITNAAGRTLTLRYTTIGATSALINQGTLITNGTTTVTGPFTTAPGSLLRLLPDGTTGFSNFTSGGSFTNFGTIELTSSVSAYSATLIVTGTNTLTNAAGATITTLVGTGGPRTIDAQLNNLGTLTLLQPLTLSHTNAAHSNSGTIDASAADLMMTLNGTPSSFTNVSTGILTIGAGRTLTVNNGTFTQGGTLNGGGTATLNNATTAFNNPFTLSALNISGGSATLSTNLSTAALALSFINTTINGPGTITNLSGQTLSVRSVTFNTDVINQGTLITDGTTTVAASNAFTAAAGSTLRLDATGLTGNSTFTAAPFTNAGAIELTTTLSAYNVILNVSGTGILTNAPGGTITSLVGTGGPRTMNVQLDNQGLVTLLHPLTLGLAGAAHTNSGTINATGGDFTINQTGTTPSFTNTGTVTIGAGRTWTISGGTFAPQQAGGVVNGGRALILNSATSTFTTAFTFDTLTVFGGTASFATAFTVTALNVTSATVSLAANLSTGVQALSFVGATINGPVTITNPAGQTLNVRSTTFNTDVINQGTLITDGNTTVAATNAFTAAAGSTLRLDATGLTGNSTFTAAPFTNAGAIELTTTLSAYNATLNVSGTGILTNAPTGTITTLVGTGGPRTLGVQLDNQGLITLNQPLSLNLASADHSNSGTIDAGLADLTISQSGTTPSFTNSSTGTLTIGAGRTLTVSSGTFTQGGTLNGGGTVTLTGVTSNFSNPFTVATLNVAGGAASFANNLSTGVQALNLSNTTINGPGTITNPVGQTLSLLTVTFNTDLINQGTLINDGGTTVAASNAFTAAALSTLRLQATGTTGQSTFTAAPFTNAGAIELTTTVSAYSATLNVSGTGILTNSPTGTITTLVGTGGPRTLGVQLDNQGLITLNQPLTLSLLSADHTNSAIIDATAADFTLNQSGTTPSFTNTGTVTVGAGRILSVSSGTFTQGGTLNGGGILTLTTNALAVFTNAFTLGTLNLTNSTANLATGVNLSTATLALNLIGSTINGPGTVANAAGQTLTLRSSNIGATSALNNQGTLVVNGTVFVSGPLTTAAGSILRLQPDGTTGFATLNTNNLTNNGAIELTSTGGAFNAQLNISSTWTNAAGGTITSFPGTGGGRSMTSMDNLGTITVLSGSSSAGILQVNGGLTTSGIVNLEIGGTALGTGYSQLTASAVLNLGGTLNVALAGGFVPTSGNTFTALVGPRGATTFATVNQPGGFSAPTYNVNSVVLSVP